MKRILLCLVIVSAVAVGCSQKQDVGDANVQLKPGDAKSPGGPASPGGAPSGGPAAPSGALATPK